MAAWDYTDRGRRYGCGSRSCLPGNRGSAHGAADRERMGHEKKHPSADLVCSPSRGQ